MFDDSLQMPAAFVVFAHDGTPNAYVRFDFMEALETMTASATGSERSTLDAIISRAGAALDYVKAHNAAQAAQQAWEASENPKDLTTPEWAAVQAADKAQENARIAYTHTQQN